MCWLAKVPRDIYVSHNIGDDKCPQLSAQDKLKLKRLSKLNSLKENDNYSDEDEQIAAQFGYVCDIKNESDQEVIKTSSQTDAKQFFHRYKETTCSFIKPVASQILTVFTDKCNKTPLHIELDSGASINFCEEAAVLNYGFEIKYNKQISKLGDGATKIESIGEINETFYRNNWEVTYKAAVCKQLSSPFIGGTVFMTDNGVEQDFAKNVIRLHNKSFTVQPTNPLSLMPIAPIIPPSDKVTNKSANLLTFKTQWSTSVDDAARKTQKWQNSRHSTM